MYNDPIAYKEGSLMAQVQLALPEAVYPHPIRSEWKLLVILRADNPTITKEEQAKQMGVSANTIRLWERQPLFQSYESWYFNRKWESIPLGEKKRRAEVQDQLDEFAQEMLDRLRDIAETSNDQKLVAQIGFDALDRAGYAAAKKDSARPINLIITPDLLLELQRRAVEMRDSGDVVVGQVEERA